MSLRVIRTSFCNKHKAIEFFIKATDIRIISVVKEMGHDRVHTQLLSAFPYLPASVLVIVVAFLADRWQTRGPLALAFLPITVAGCEYHGHRSIYM